MSDINLADAFGKLKVSDKEYPIDIPTRKRKPSETSLTNYDLVKECEDAKAPVTLDTSPPTQCTSDKSQLSETTVVKAEPAPGLNVSEKKKHIDEDMGKLIESIKGILISNKASENQLKNNENNITEENKIDKEFKEEHNSKNTTAEFGSSFTSLPSFADIQCEEDLLKKEHSCNIGNEEIEESAEKPSFNTSADSLFTGGTSGTPLHQQLECKKPKLSDSLQSLIEKQKTSKEDKMAALKTLKEILPKTNVQTLPKPCAMDKGDVDGEMNELCGYFENNLNIPKKMSAMAESMYA